MMVSAWIATKSLLMTSPVTLLYLVCFWMMRLRFAQVISLKRYVPAYSSPNLLSSTKVSEFMFYASLSEKVCAVQPSLTLIMSFGLLGELTFSQLQFLKRKYLPALRLNSKLNAPSAAA